MVSVPTSLYGTLGFLVVAGFLLAEFSIGDPGTDLAKITADIQTQNTNIENIQIRHSSDNESATWYSGIADTASMIYSYATIILTYVWMPLYLTVTFITSIAGLPSDLLPIITALLFIGVFSTILYFIRGIQT